MKTFAIFVLIFGPSLALPLLSQRLLLGSNSNEVLLGLGNPNIPQGGAMNVLVPGIYPPQLQQKYAGLPQILFGAYPGLAAQLPNQVVVPNVGTQSQLLDPMSQNQPKPNQVMSYVVSYGTPQKQGQMPAFSIYPPQQPSPKLVVNQHPMEETFGCIVPQMNGEMMMPLGGLQLQTKSPIDPLVLDEDFTTMPNYENNKEVTPEVINSP
uniref:odontogenic ameloblast-associated protein n=1 Tax=Pyxicephalus adspersus TaxID=30357 RepID=UPI003B5C65AA